MIRIALSVLTMLWMVPAEAAPRVLVTIKPIHSLVASVMEGVATPGLLIAGAASEHGYALKPSDAGKIAGAALVFWVGPDLETYLIGPLDALAPHATRVALEHAAGVHLLPGRSGGLWGTRGESDEQGGVDPHIWLDPKNAIAMTAAIADVLSRADPPDAARYAANARRTIADLGALDARLRAELAPLRTSRYIVFHDAYQYFEKTYGLEPLGAVTVAPDRPVGPRRIATLHDAVVSGRAVCVFSEPQFTPDLIGTLREGTPARTGVLDPLGAQIVPGPKLYDAVLSNLGDALRRCLLPAGVAR
jgi:zinc transport system substrate-binding protein